MDYKTIIYKVDGHIATITLNRPDRLNAYNNDLLRELMDAIDAVRKDDEVRVLVLTGAGKGFCAGGDIQVGGIQSELVAVSPEERRQEIRHGLQDITRRLHHLEIPTIAMVNGAAAGVGFDWALACDIRIGSENTRMSVAFTKIGVTPGTGGAWLLPRVVGIPKAAELIFTSDILDAAEAGRIGLLNKVVPAGELEKETMALARRIAENPPVALRMAKMQLYRGLGMDLDTALEVIAACQGVAMSTEDHKEGVMAFRQKRKPIFRGR